MIAALLTWSLVRAADTLPTPRHSQAISHLPQAD